MSGYRIQSRRQAAANARRRMNLVGQQFGDLRVTAYFKSDRYKNSLFRCVCRCGLPAIRMGNQLKQTAKLGQRSACTRCVWKRCGRKPKSERKAA